VEQRARDAEARYRAAAGAVFRQLRNERGWSLREFGERVGVAHTSLYAVERENVSPTIDTLARVAEAVDLTLPAILRLILDELTSEGDESLAGLLAAASDLSVSQRSELLRFIDWLRYRDSHQ
jgi:transcriptional regulator with XRE-family HTH domain